MSDTAELKEAVNKLVDKLDSDLKEWILNCSKKKKKKRKVAKKSRRINRK